MNKNITKQTYLALSLTLTATLLAACSQEEPGVSPVDGDGTVQSITITAVAGSRDAADNDPATRISYDELPDGSQTHILWSAQEQFSLCYTGGPAGTNYLFTKDGTEAGVPNATFTYSGAGLDTPPAATLYAVYPGTTDITANATQVMVNFATQQNNDKHFMIATLNGSDLQDSWENANFTFRTRVALLKLTLTHADFATQPLTNITLRADNLCKWSYFNLVTDAWSTRVTDTDGININTTVTADASGMATLYVAQPPSAIPTGDITITALAGSKVYSGTLASGTFEDYYVYTAPEVTMTTEASATMRFTVKPTATQTEFTLPFGNTATGNYILTVDWGDGSQPTSIPAGTLTSNDLLKHEYANTGQSYPITLTTTAPATGKQIPAWNFNNRASAPMLVSMDSPILNTGNTSFTYCFLGCTNLTSIPEGLFAANTAATDFSNCFRSCTNLAALPEGLFAANTAATNFQSCFYECHGLISIPEGLFAANTVATNFQSCFDDCRNLAAIPEGLFATNTAAVNFQRCFYDCRSLTAIPERLFAANTAATDFSFCFDNCRGLTAIPEGLFATNTAAISFQSCFQGCTSAVLNSNIFCDETDENKARRFLNQTINFINCFNSVGSALAAGQGGIAPALWTYAYGTGIANKTDCFTNCTKVTNVSDIPWGWYF